MELNRVRVYSLEHEMGPDDDLRVVRMSDSFLNRLMDSIVADHNKEGYRINSVVEIDNNLYVFSTPEYREEDV
jgi:hypothetical protein